MKLFHSPSSPFGRKVLVCAAELGLAPRIELSPSAPHPVNRDARVVAHNPLGQVPTLITDDGEVLFDSRVICEYLDSLVPQPVLFPPAGPARFRALRDQAVADGLVDAALLVRYEETTRDSAVRSAGWIAGQLDKVDNALQFLDRGARELARRVDIGTIAVGCALGYLDFRFPQLAWRSRCPALAQWFEAFGARESMRATMPHAAPA
jgi:glutathione S-transferase